MVQSVESSNRIEGVTVEPDRLKAIMAKKTKPKDRSEGEVAGYRDVLAEIHANAVRMELTPELILDFHRKMYAHTSELVAIGKRKIMQFWRFIWMEGNLCGFALFLL